MNTETLTCDLAGLSFTYPKNDPYVKTTAEHLILRDEYKLLELRRAGHRPRNIIDIGGNCGAFGLQALRLFPDADLFAYEPLSDLAMIYRRNLNSNNFARQSHVAAFACGSSASKNCQDLYLGNETITVEEKLILRTPGSTGSFLEGSWDPYETGAEPLIEKFAVKRISLVETLWATGVRCVDLLKVDCEGSEGDVFQDLLDHGWFPRISWIRLEWHGRHNLKRLTDIFMKAGTHDFHFDVSPGRNLGFGIAHNKFDA